MAPSTQNQALSALLFLYKEVLDRPLHERIAAIRAKRPKYVPTVLTLREVEKLLNEMAGPSKLVAQVLYGSGLRIGECLMLRVQNMDFENGWIVVAGGKGGRGRVTVLPKSLIPALKEHLEIIRALHETDLQAGLGSVVLPRTRITSRIEVPAATFDGSSSFHRPMYSMMPRRASPVGGISIRPRSAGSSAWPQERLASTSA